MKKDKKQSLPEGSEKIRVLLINNRRFVVGLKWQTIREQLNPMREIKSIGKAYKLDLVAVRRSDSIQAGFAPKTRQKLRGAYSLIVSLASLLKGCSIAVVPLGETPTGVKEYTLVGRTEKGGIHIFSDEIYQEDDLPQTVIDLKEQLRGAKSNLEIRVFGDTKFDWVTDELDLPAILSPEALKKDFKLRPLTWGMTGKQWTVTGLAVAVLMGATVAYLQYQDQQEEAERKALQESIAKQNELNKEARYKAALAGLRHPWTDKPSVKAFIAGCDAAMYRVDLAIAGRTTTAVTCTESNARIESVRPTDSTSTLKAYVDEVKKKYGVSVDFSYQDSNKTGFSFPLKMKPDGDDPMEPVNQRLINFISLFQSQNIKISIQNVDVPKVEKNKFGEEMPQQDWKEYSFSVETDVPPRMIFTADEYKGIRLSEIYNSANTSDGSLKYRITGELYGKP